MQERRFLLLAVFARPVPSPPTGQPADRVLQEVTVLKAPRFILASEFAELALTLTRAQEHLPFVYPAPAASSACRVHLLHSLENVPPGRMLQLGEVHPSLVSFALPERLP
jgi:hypothetical protein